MGTGKMTVKENSISYLFHAVQKDLGSDLSQKLHKTFPAQ